MQRRVATSVAAFGLALGIVVASGVDRPATAQMAMADVVMGEFIFDPAEVVVGAGLQMFNLNNMDSRRHNMVIGYNGTDLESETLAAGTGGVWEVVLDQAGTYEFWCNIGNHRERGMVGTLTVQ